MSRGGGWRRIEDEARRTIRSSRSHPLPAYSEFMPSPYLRPKPYELWWPGGSLPDEDAFDVSEYEQADELEPGLTRIAGHLLGELSKLVAGRPTELSRTLLADNPAWPIELSEAASAGRLPSAPLTILFPLALSRTQDDKGNAPWTLFGASHEGASRPFWRSFGPREKERFERLCAWATVDAPSTPGGLRVLESEDDLPDFARSLSLRDDSALDGVHTLVTFRPFATLAEGVRRAYLEGRLRLLPHPASLAFFEHRGYVATLQNRMFVASCQDQIFELVYNPGSGVAPASYAPTISTWKEAATTTSPVTCTEATACATITKWEDCAATNYCLHHECAGSTTYACSTYDLGGCTLHSGCLYDTALGNCAGTPDPCPARMTFNCASEPGCSLPGGPPCVSPTSTCASLGLAACASAPNCAQKW